MSYWIYKTFIFGASGLHQFELICFRSNRCVFRTPGGTELGSFRSLYKRLKNAFTNMSHILRSIVKSEIDLKRPYKTPKGHFDEFWETDFDSRSFSNRKTKMVQFGLYISLCILTMSWVVYRGSFWFGIARFTTISNRNCKPRFKWWSIDGLYDIVYTRKICILNFLGTKIYVRL